MKIWQKAQDEKRAKEGKPPWKPSSGFGGGRGQHSLDAEAAAKDSPADYVQVEVCGQGGIMEDSDGEVDCVSEECPPPTVRGPQARPPASERSRVHAFRRRVRMRECVRDI